MLMMCLTTSRTHRRTIVIINYHSSVWRGWCRNVLTCFIRMHCLHRKFIHTLHDRLVNAAAARGDRWRTMASSHQGMMMSSTVLVQSRAVLHIVVVELWLHILLLVVMIMLATCCGLGHRCSHGAGWGQGGRGRARRGLVNRVTGSVEERRTRWTR